MSCILKKTVFFIIAACLQVVIAFTPVSAQVVSRNGWFTADFNNACMPFTIHLTETDTFPPETVRQFSFEGDGYFVAFNDGDPIQYTYSNAGSYKLVEVVNKDFTGKTDTMDITVHDNTQPSFTLYTCESNGVTLKIDNDQYEKYKIFFTPSDSFEIGKGDIAPSFTYTPGSHQVTVKGEFIKAKDNCGTATHDFATIQSLIQASFNSITLLSRNPTSGAVNLNFTLAPDVVYQLEKAENIPAGFSYYSSLNGSSLDVNSIDTENKIQLFRIAAYDACSDKYLYSDTLSSLSISVKAQNNQNLVEWKTYPVGFASYNLNRDNQPYQTFSNSNISYYVDKGVKCFNTYCYSIVSVNRNGHKSYSDTACVEAYSIYFPPAITNTTVSAADKGYELSWLPPDNIDINEFFIQRILDQDVYSTIDTTLVPSGSDTSVDNTTGSYCYSVSYLDQCKNRSNVGYTSCSMHLVLNKNDILTWNDYSGWSKGVKKYILEIYDEAGKFQQEVDVGKQTGYKPDDFFKHQINSYRVRALSNDSEPFIAYSNYVVKTLSAVINVPNSFTPDGDGLNDIFKPIGTEMQQFSMKVYSRGGDLVFETDNQDNGWDGSYNGAPAPQDTYIFDIIAEDFKGNSFRLRGALVLLRH